MEALEIFLRGLHPLTLLIGVSVLYFIISFITNKYVMNRKFDFKTVLIPTLVGLLFYVVAISMLQ